MRDPRYEHFLTSEAVEWHYEPEVPLASVRVDEKAMDNIRLTARRDEDHVLRLMLALDQGDELPAIMVYPEPGGFRMLNGIHRHRAFGESGRTTIDVYVAHLDGATEAGRQKIELLQRIVNVRLEGKTMTPEEAVVQGIELVKAGHSVTDAAARLLLKPGTLATAVRHEKALDELAALTGRTAFQLGTELGKAGVDQIARIPLNEAKRAAADLCFQAKLNSREVQAFALELKSARTVDDTNAILARWREDMRDRITATAAGRFRAPMSPLRDMQLQERKFFAKVDALVQLHERRRLTDDERRDTIRHLQRLIAQCQAQIQKLQGAMTAPPPEPERPAAAARGRRRAPARSKSKPRASARA